MTALRNFIKKIILEADKPDENIISKLKEAGILKSIDDIWPATRNLATEYAIDFHDSSSIYVKYNANGFVLHNHNMPSMVFRPRTHIWESTSAQKFVAFLESNPKFFEALKNKNTLDLLGRLVKKDKLNF